MGPSVGETAIQWYNRMGTTTLPGPCATHVDVGLGCGVNVGVMVAVFVTVAVSVGGGGVNVNVAVAVGVGAAKSVLLHPDSRIEIPRNKAIIFFIY